MTKIFTQLPLQNKPLHQCFQQIITTAGPIHSPSKFINTCWTAYLEEGSRLPDAKNSNGQFFELLIQYILCTHQILPFYVQAKVAFVPNVNFDILLYTQEIGPIVLSIKTSLRERYKQADLEAIALKQVHRKARTFLCTLSEESHNINKKIAQGHVVGLEKVILCTTPALDDMISLLQQYTCIRSQRVDLVLGNLISANAAEKL